MRISLRVLLARSIARDIGDVLCGVHQHPREDDGALRFRAWAQNRNSAHHRRQDRRRLRALTAPLGPQRNVAPVRAPPAPQQVASPDFWDWELLLDRFFDECRSRQLPDDWDEFDYELDRFFDENQPGVQTPERDPDATEASLDDSAGQLRVRPRRAQQGALTPLRRSERLALKASSGR